MKKYIINNQEYLFSKERFHSLLKEVYRKENKDGNSINMTTLYEQLGNAVGVTSDAIRKWYGLTNDISPNDITMIRDLADFFNCDDEFSLLAKVFNSEEQEKMKHNEYMNDSKDRELVIAVYNEFLNYTNRRLERSHADIISKDNNITYIDNAASIADDVKDLSTLEDIVNRSVFDANPITIQKLRDIIFSFSEDLTDPSLSTKWDKACSDWYYDARDLYRWRCSDLGWGDESFEEFNVSEYLEQNYPDYSKIEAQCFDIPLTYDFIYRREFAKTLENLFRSEFPEYFAYSCT